MKNIQLIIKDNCPTEYVEIIKFYWELNDETLEFTNKPKGVRSKFNIEQPKLNKIIQPNSAITFYLHCKNCNSYEFIEVNSQSTFNILFKSYNSSRNIFKCKHCEEIANLEKQKEQERERQERLLELDKAVDEKRWMNLNSFQYELLHLCLTKSFSELKKHYWSKLGENRYGKLFHELKVLAKMDLLEIDVDPWNGRIKAFQYYSRMKENFIYNPAKTETTAYHQDFERRETSQLRLTLTIDKSKFHPDSPKYAGLVKFKQRIVIEPDVEYSFAQWERSGDNLYFVLTPIDEIYPAPNQTPIVRVPTSLQDGIRDFLESINPENGDW
ncbi:hypothetical protein [uncultured Christiangramia sp.]|uniref:hypothetical protein n=1 Tax=uncultured Christiangramia sp. TaxID=503836 RepID=UPI0026128AF6|nr:hypothetical protein [uncultured Christiangramia sp.]